MRALLEYAGEVAAVAHEQRFAHFPLKVAATGACSKTTARLPRVLQRLRVRDGQAVVAAAELSIEVVRPIVVLFKVEVPHA